MTSVNLNYRKYLIVGATGGSGRELVNLLISKGKNVGIIVRNKTKAKTVFKENYEKIDKVIEFELGLSQVRCEQEPVYNEEILEALNWSDVLISSLGPTRGGNPQQSDYTATVELINHCLKSENSFANKIFVYISTMYITRPYAFISFFLNSIVPYVMGWKALAENRIRQSELNYLIVRPGRLIDADIPKTVEIHQGDNSKGQISRSNLAKMIFHSLSDSLVNKGKVTVEVVEKKSFSGVVEINSPVKVDDESSIITANHFTTTRNITVCIYTILFIIILGLISKFK
jgi:hypothetical protein